MAAFLRPRVSFLFFYMALGMASLALPSCDDVSCVFTTGCRDGDGGPGPIAGEGATLPLDGQWIQTGPPRIERVLPEGGASSTTPVVIVFNETMTAESLAGAFTLAPAMGGNVNLGNPVLVGDGRVLLFFPPVPLVPGDYFVRVATNAMPTDLTGQTLTVPMGDLTAFSVDDPDPNELVLVATYPLMGEEPTEGESDAGQTSELVVVFDRALDPSSVTASSFDLKVGGMNGTGGTDPIPDPLAQVLEVSGNEEPRVLVWRSLDADDVPVPLGNDAEVRLELDGLAAIDGEELEPTTLFFHTAPFPAPLSVSLLSSPPDAIGIANLSPGADELTVQVDLENAQAGDFVDLILFGNDPEPEMGPEVLAFLRSVELAGTSPIMTATFTLEDIDFTTGGSAETARVADGAVAFAFRLRRGGIVSPLRLLDADLSRPGIQDPLLDTEPPSILELFEPDFRSDQRGLVLVGRASELVESAAVTSDVGDNLANGAVPPVVGSDLQGRFVTAPVGNALLPAGPIDCEVVVHDAANNPSAPVSGVFSQHGAVGPGAFAPGDTIAVEVFDARSLQPLSGALVVTHADMGNGVDFPLTDSETTDTTGGASLTTAAAAGTLLSVDRTGYDLFTLQGVTSSRLSIGLWPSGSSAVASISGAVTTESPFGSLFTFLDLKIGDTRLPEEVARTFDTLPCEGIFGTPSCDFLPHDVRPERLGASSVVVGNFQIASPGAFAPEELVQAFELVVPRPQTPAGEEDEFDLVVPFLFAEPGVDPSEQPIEFPPVQLDASGAPGIDLDMLEDDPSTTGAPHVTLEALVPGVGGSLVVGLGLAFPSGTGLWDVRSAHPGAVTAGFFAEQGVVDPDLFLRAELRDMDGDRSLRRPRASALPDLPMVGSPPVPMLAPADVPLLQFVMAGGPLGTDRSLDLSVTDVLPDALGTSGLYEVRLTDDAGRAWHLWRTDAPDGLAPLSIHFPDLGPTGSALGAGLDGAVEVWAWPALDPAAFLWSDLEREHDVFVSAKPVSVP